MAEQTADHSAALPASRVYTPIPDPTLLTTEQIRREQGSLREVIEARLNGMDTATRLLAGHVDRVPSDIDRQVEQLTALFGERMAGIKAEVVATRAGIQLQFDERDIRSRAAEDAAKVAVNAALQAQKEAAAAQNDSNAAAITKSEAATVKQIDGILALLASNTQGINDKIAAITSRLDRGEAIIQTDQLARGDRRNDAIDRRSDGSSNVAILGVGMVVITVVVGLIGFVLVHTNTAAAPSPVIYQLQPPGAAPAHP